VVIVFYRTGPSGSDEAARVALKDGTLSGPEAYVELLLRDQDGDPEEILRQAPQRLSGSYLQAELVSR